MRWRTLTRSSYRLCKKKIQKFTLAIDSHVLSDVMLYDHRLVTFELKAIIKNILFSPTKNNVSAFYSNIDEYWLVLFIGYLNIFIRYITYKYLIFLNGARHLMGWWHQGLKHSKFYVFYEISNKCKQTHENVSWG